MYDRGKQPHVYVQCDLLPDEPLWLYRKRLAAERKAKRPRSKWRFGRRRPS